METKTTVKPTTYTMRIGYRYNESTHKNTWEKIKFVMDIEADNGEYPYFFEVLQNGKVVKSIYLEDRNDPFKVISNLMFNSKYVK